MQPKITTNGAGKYSIAGELNNQTVPVVSVELGKLISTTEGKSISLDLALVSRSDSAGVALLVEVMQLARSSDVSVVFLHLPQQMKDIAGISGLLDILPLQEK